jgi:hypothetical protein
VGALDTGSIDGLGRMTQAGSPSILSPLLDDEGRRVVSVCGTRPSRRPLLVIVSPQTQYVPRLHIVAEHCVRSSRREATLSR